MSLKCVIKASGSVKKAYASAKHLYGMSEAYRSLVPRSGIEGNAAADWCRLPIITKEFYKSHGMEALRSSGEINSILSLVSSSGGGTGKGLIWPSGDRQRMLQSLPVVADIWTEAFELKTKRSLVIIGNSLGSWVGGESLAFYFKMAAIVCELPLTVCAIGADMDQIVTVMCEWQHMFDQIIVTLCPSAIWYLSFAAQLRSVTLPWHKITYYCIGETFQESLRVSVQELSGVAPGMVSFYASADAGFLGFESQSSVRIRQYLDAHRDFAEDVGLGNGVIPPLFHLIWSNYYEEVDGNLLVTVNNVLPLVRYDQCDAVTILSWRQLLCAIALHSGNDSWRHMPPIPYAADGIVALWGRSDGCVQLCGTNIFDYMLQDAFNESCLAVIGTGSISAELATTDGRSHLNIDIELKPGQSPARREMIDDAYRSFVNHLACVQPEFRVDYERLYGKAEQDGFRILQFSFSPFGSPSHTGRDGVKQRRVFAAVGS